MTVIERSTRMLAALCGIAAACAIAADAPRDGRGVPFNDDLISRLEGRWSIVRTIGNREEKNTLEAAWVLDHQFLELHMKDAAVPPKYEAHVYVGYSNSEARYVIHWLDVFGGHYSMRGYGVRDGNAIEFRFPEGDGTIGFYNTFTYDRPADAWTMKLENARRDGTRTPFAMDRLVRTRTPQDP